MAYDEELAESIRESLDPMGVVVTEMKMFGVGYAQSLPVKTQKK